LNLLNSTAKAISGLAHRFRGDNLKARCARSSVILGIGAFVAKFFGFGSKVVLTRLLVPEVIGLMVLVLSMTALLEVLTDVGIKQSVIQNKSGALQEYLNMAWWFQMLRGTGLYVIGFFIAPLLCQFYFADKSEIITLYSMPELVVLVRSAFLMFLLGGLVSPRAYVLEKEFKFGKAVFLNQGSAILGSAVTIVLAFVMRNIWAVIIGFISMGALRCLFSYVLCPFLPRLSFDRHSFNEIFRFGQGMLGLPILTYIAFNIDILVAGKLISADLVGFYGMALVLAIASSDLFGRVISPVLLPAFAEKQDDKKTLAKAVLKITKIAALFAIPALVPVVMCSKTILSLVYGEQFSAVAVPFSLLCVYVLLLIQGSTLGNVFFGLGQPAKHRLFVVLRALILVILIYPAIRLFGLTGAAAVLLLASFIALCAQVFIMHRVIGLNIFEYVISWLPGVVLAVPVLAVVMAVRGLIPDSHIVHLTVGALSCITISTIGLLLPNFSDRRRQHKQVVASAARLVDNEDVESARTL
jgi:O-antigen/teichoic acid export membrane protein